MTRPWRRAAPVHLLSSPAEAGYLTCESDYVDELQPPSPRGVMLMRG
jgi:hypothetical protein